MSKRSVDMGDSGKKTTAKPDGAKPREAASVPLKKKAKTVSNGGIWQSSDLYLYAGLIVAALLSFYLRAIVPWNRVFSGDNVIFSSETDAWYHMMLAKGTVINLQRLWFDPMTYFPHGTPLHFGPFLSWAIATFSYIFGLGHPSNHLIEVVGAFMPAVLGALLVFPAYFIGRELFGKNCGLISALIIAVLPGQVFSRTTLGFTDHHAAEILFSSLTMMFLLLALRSGKGMSFAAVQRGWTAFKRPLLYSALAGVSLGLYIDAWSSGFLFEGIILLFIMMQSIFDHIRGKNVEYLGISGAIAFLVATLLVLPFVDSYYGFNHYLYSLFQPTILLLGVVGVIFFAVLSRFIREKGFSRYYYPGALAGLVVIGTTTLYFAIPSFTRPLLAGFAIFQQRTGGAATVGEASALLSQGGAFSFSSVLTSFPGFGSYPTFFQLPEILAILFSTFTFALVALILLAVRNLKFQKPAEILILTWSLIILIMALAQNRFTYYYAINVAILTGFLVTWVLQRFGIRDVEFGSEMAKGPVDLIASNLKIILAAILIFAFIIMPSLSWSIVYAQSAGGPDSDWLTSTAWLQNNTPSPGMDLYEKYVRPAEGKYAYPDAAYGIMSWWDYGHLIEYVGHRIPNANPFQQGIGSVTKNTPGSSPFFLAENESQAEKVLANLDLNRSQFMNTKYVMIDEAMATGKFHAMAAWSSISNSKYMSLVAQPQGEQYVGVQIWREPYFKSMTARMYFFDGSETVGDMGVGLAYRPMTMDNGAVIPVLTEAPKITRNRTELEAFINDSRDNGDMAEIAARSPSSSAFPLEALQHYRLVHESEGTGGYGQKAVKTFEHVPGAVISGNAPPGTKVVAAVPVMTNQNRAFLYQQSNSSDASGRFVLVLPYSTEGAIASGTNFDVKPMSAYQLTVGDKVYELRVPEEYVLNGDVITL
ncbi:MAG: oligosaccharyl transferase, archaeosortase A system-associated [Methanotrichaceae archaeon]|nr:oligosaccharyl transferase, archaeosortase A system-associated [Methanotrichaceae archaeon]